MQKIIPFLWFNGQAEEAARFYTAIFKKSKIERISRYGKAGPGQPGTVMTVVFRLEGQTFIALNGDTQFNFTPALSLFTLCKTQAEVDELWEKLSAGGKQIQCGWLTDKFGVTWQVVPDGLLEMLEDKDEERSQRVMTAMCQMIKLDINALEQAYDGESKTKGKTAAKIKREPKRGKS